MADPVLAWTFRRPWTLETRVGPIAHARKPPHYVTEEEVKDLLAGDPKRAEGRARQALAADPGDWQARALLGGALRQQKRYEEARAVLEPVVASAPHMSDAMREYGLTLIGHGEQEKGIDALCRAIDFCYLDKSAWYWLGEFLGFGEIISTVPGDGRVAQAREACRDERFEDAEILLRQLMAASPNDAAILKFLGEVFLRMGRWAEAKPLLQRSVELAPDSHTTRFRCATMLFAHAHFEEALPHIDELRKRDPASRLYQSMKFVCLSRSHKSDRAVAEFQAMDDGCRNQPGLWLEYARQLRNERGGTEILVALRKAWDLVPSFVDAYVAAAFSKSVRLDDRFVAEVLAQISCGGLSYEDRARLHFALGKAFEDMMCYKDSFEHYRISNDILCTSRNFGPEMSARFKQRITRFYRPSFFRKRQGWGNPAPDPIFIVGMPRAGSTLVEQILSSHSQIEGLGELHELTEISGGLEREMLERKAPPYPVLLRDIDSARLRSLGDEYLLNTRRRRRTAKPYFTDKMPANRNHVGFIHLVLPNARIIDVRRHPLDCCFSCFKHYFPAGQPLSTNLRDIARSYVDYVEMMAFFDGLLPGRLHRVIYEHLVDDPEREVRRLLDHIGLPFEDQCLRFHENRRFVATISQEQVRMPLYKTGKEQWRRYESWLGPLKEELGYVLERYPEVPEYFAAIHVRWKRPLSLGVGANPFATVNGVRQSPFEIASGIAGLAA